MENFGKAMKTGILTSAWNSLPLVMIGGAIFLFVDVKNEKSYYAAILFFGAVVLLISAIVLIWLIGFLQIDYDELSNKRNRELGLKLDMEDEEIIDDITEENTEEGAQILCLTSPTEF